MNRRQRRKLARQEAEQQMPIPVSVTQNRPIQSFLAAPAPRRTNPRDLPITTFTDWGNVQRVRGALTTLDQGKFLESALMLDAMLGDSHIAAKLDDRLAGLFGSPFDMAPPPTMEEDATALEVAEDARQMWPHLVSDSAEQMIARDGIMLGVGLGEIVIDPAPSGWKLRLKHWHMRHVWWNWQTRTYWVNTMRGTEEILPDEEGGFTSTWRDGEGKDNVTRWMLYTPYGYQRGWVNGRVKAVALWWLLRSWAARDWGRHSEVYGIPARKVKMPAEWSDDEKQQALREVTSMASEAIVRCPQKADGTGFDVDLLEVSGTAGPDVFDKLINRAESAITVALVGQTLTTQVGEGGGNRALGQVHERVEAKIRARDEDKFSASAHAAIMIPWTVWNYGDAALAPFPTWAVDPPADLKQKGDGLKAVGDGIASLKQAGIPVDRAKVCQEAGIPIEEDGEFTEPAPPPDPFGARPGGPPGAGEEPNDAKEPKDGKEGLSRVDLARRRKAAIQAQVYVDRVADLARETAAQILASDVREIRKAINEATSIEDLKVRLRHAYRGMKPDELAELTKRVIVMGDLSGRLAAAKEG